MSEISILGTRAQTIVVSILLIVGGIGAAAGAAMAGQIGGDLTTEVDRAITIESGTVDAPGFVSVNDDGTAFRSTAQIQQGDDYHANLTFEYHGQTGTNAELVLDVPTGLSVEVTPDESVSDANVSIGRVDADTWLLRVDDGTGRDRPFTFHLSVDIVTRNDVEPGVYSIDGTLYPVDV